MIDLAAIVTFDATLKAKSKINLDDETRFWFSVHTNYLNKIKFVFLILYLFLNPLFQTPDWCINNATVDQKGFIYQCDQVITEHGLVNYSSLITITP